MGQITLPFVKRSDIVFDLETKHSFDEVGGRAHLEKLGISLGVVYDYGDNEYHVYRENEIDGLIRHILRANTIIGFNCDGFDIPLLLPHIPSPPPRLQTLDLMKEAKKPLGFRPSLAKLADATLHEGKAGAGLDAIRWYREGNWDRLIHYCKEDVRITKEIYEFGKEKRYLLFPDRDGTIIQVPVTWS